MPAESAPTTRRDGLHDPRIKDHRFASAPNVRADGFRVRGEPDDEVVDQYITRNLAPLPAVGEVGFGEARIPAVAPELWNVIGWAEQPNLLGKRSTEVEEDDFDVVAHWLTARR